MKSRSFLIFLLIISLAILPSLQLALGAQSSSSSSSTTTSTSTSTAPRSPYSERADIYTAGSNDYWMVTLSPVNASRPDIVAAESVSGVSAYEVTAVQAGTASDSSPLFWSGGYGVVHLPFLPYSGVFVNVTASSPSAAQSAASDFGSLFGTTFSQISSGGGNYTFYGPANFAIAGATIFKTAPSINQGLATVTNESALAADPTPTAILTGVRNGSSFTHVLRFGSTESSAVGSNNSFLLENAMNLQASSFVSSPAATSTKLVIHSLDGLIRTHDNATVSNDLAGFSSTYSVSVSPGTRIKPNVTITQNPPVLTATRTVDVGSAVSGGLISVTLNLRNTAYNGTIQNASVNDSWWRSYPSLFSLSVGNSSFSVPTLAPQQNFSQAYVLKVTSSASNDIIVPPAKVAYSFSAGSLVINATTTTNQLEVRTNSAGPALQLSAGTDISSGSSFGKPGNYVVTVTNTGNDPAIDLSVLNNTDQTLTPGGVWSFKIPLSLTNLADRNLTQTFKLGWTSPDGALGSLVSNPASLLLSHSNVLLPAVYFKLTATTSALGLASRSINASWALENKGSAVADNITVTQPLPNGVTCQSVVTGNGTCGASGFSLTLSSIGTFINETGTILLNFSNNNYVIPGASVTTAQGSLTLPTYGSALPIAAGLSVTKTFSPGVVFVGQDSNATMRVLNGGSLPVFNVSLSTTADSFDTPVSGALSQQYPTLNSNAADSLNYSVKMVLAGNHTSASTTISYLFGGYRVQYPVTSGTVLVYKPIKVTTSTPSSPREGTDFALALNVQNQSPKDVSDVSVSFKLPSGMAVVSYSSGFQVSGRTVTLSLPSLAAGATTNNTITLKADFDGTFTLSTPALTFSYLGSTVPGIASASPISVGVDALFRYELPIGVAVILALAVAVYMHRKPVAQAK